MQVGTRWNVGAAPPPKLPATMVDAINAVEQELAGFDASDWRWTLTWLEGRPIAELDDGTTIQIDASGSVTVIEPSSD